MKIYFVLETIPKYHDNIAIGTYSSLEKAQNAVLEDVAGAYTPEEMKQFDFYNEGRCYDTPETEFLEACTYIIFESELDA